MARLKTAIWKTVLTVLVCFVILSGCKWVINEYWWKGPNREPPCWTSADSARKGLLVSMVCPIPENCNINGKVVRFADCWVEEAGRPSYHFVWFPYYKRTGNYYCCFHLQPGGDEVFEEILAHFKLRGVAAGKVVGVSYVSGRDPLFWFFIDKPNDLFSSELLLIDSAGADPSCAFQFALREEKASK